MNVSLDEVDFNKLSPLNHNVLPKSTHTHTLPHTQTAKFVCLQANLALYKRQSNCINMSLQAHTLMCVCVSLDVCVCCFLQRFELHKKSLEKTLTIAKFAEKFASNLHNEANCQTVCVCVCVCVRVCVACQIVCPDCWPINNI